MFNLRRLIATSFLLLLFASITIQAQQPVGSLKGHTDAVYSVAVSPDGKLYVTGSFDRSIRIWDAVTGKELRKYAGTGAHQSIVLSVAFSPSGEYVVSGGSDNNVFLWDVPLRTAIKEFAHSASVTGVSVTNDGKSLGGIGADGTYKSWTLADGKQGQSINTTIPAKAGQFTAGQAFVVGGQDGFLRWYSTTDGKSLGSIGTSNGPINALAVSGGNSVYTIADDGQLKFWQTPAAAPKALPALTGAISQIIPAPDGSYFLTIEGDKTVRSFSVNSNTPGKEITPPTAITSIANWPNGTVIATGHADGKITFWNRADGKLVETLPAHTKKVAAIAVSSSGSSFTSIDQDGAAKVWAYPIVKPKPPAKDAKDPKDSGDVKPTATFTIPGGVPNTVLYHPTANQLLTLSADKVLRLLELPTGKEAKTITTLPLLPKAFAISRDFQTVAVALDKAVKLYNLADGKETFTLPADATALAFNADKTRLLTGHADKTAKMWDVAKGTFIQAVEHTGPITGVMMAPSQQAIYVTSSDKSIALLPIQAPRIVPLSTKPLRSLAMHPNQTHLLIGGDEPVVQLVNIGNGVAERKLEGAEGAVFAVAASKNSQLVATGGQDQTIRLYQFNDGKLLSALKTKSPIQVLAFHPGNNMLVSILADKRMVAWNIANQPGQPLPEEFGTIVQEWQLPDEASSAVFTEKGDLFVGLKDKTIKQYRIALNTPVRNIQQHPNLVDAVAFSPDGKFLATGCHDGQLRIFETEKWAATKIIQAHTTPAPPAAIYSVTWSPDGKQILSTSFDKSMKLWDVASGSLVKEFKAFTEKTFEKGHQDQVFCATFSKDGKTIYSGSSDRKIKKWNVTDGNVIAEFTNPTIKGEVGQSHPNGIYSLRLSPDGNTLYSVGPAPRNKGYVAKWNAADGKFITAKETTEGPIYYGVLLNDGKNLLVGCGPKVRQEPNAEALLVLVP